MAEVTDPSLLGQLNGSPGRAAAAAGGPPVFRTGAPTQPRKDQLSIAKDEATLANDAARLNMEKQRLGLAEQDQALQNAKAAREANELALRGGVQTTESERTAGFLATRVGGGIDDLMRIGGDANKAPSLSEAMFSKSGMLGNYGLSGNRQRVNNAQLDILDAALTLGTGAAYTKEQLEGYRQSYFPQPGDEEGTIDDKRRRLLRLLEAAKLKAGASAPQIDKALQAFGAPAVDLQVEAGSKGTVSPTGEGQFATPADKEYTAVIRNAVSKGAGMEDLDLLAAQYGYGSFSKGADADQWRQMLKLRDQGKPYAIGDVRSGFKGPSLVGTLAATPGGAAAIAAANTLTAGTLDEIGGALGGDAEQIQEAKDASRAAHPVASVAGDLAGAGLQAAALGPLARMAPAPVANAFARLSPAARGAIGGGAAGGAYGAGENNDNRLAGLLLGGGLGAGTGAVAGRVFGGRGGGPGAGGPTPEQAALAQAAEAEGVPTNLAMFDPSQATKLGALESTMAGNRTINAGLDATENAIEGRVARLGANGTPVERETLGNTIGEAGRNALAGERRRLGDVYTRANDVSRGMQAETPEAVGVIDRAITALAENPNANATKIANLQRIRADFVDPNGNLIPKSIASIRDLRTTLRDAINEGNLTMTRDDRLASQIVDAASNDMSRALQDNAPQAAKLFKQADDGWRAISQEENQVWDKVLGPADRPKSGGAVMATIQTMLRDNAGDLSRVWQRLSPVEQRDAAATLAEGLGRTADDGTFSVARFLSQTDKLKPEQRRIVFGDEGARSIANLRTLSRAFQDSTSSVNRSRSGVVGNFNNFLRDLVTGGGVLGAGGFAAGGGQGAMTGAGLGGSILAARGLGRLLSARAMMSPDLSRWMATAAQARTPGAVANQIGKLSIVAKRDPALSQDIQSLHQILSETFLGTSKAAASNGQEEPQQ